MAAVGTIQRGSLGRKNQHDWKVTLGKRKDQRPEEKVTHLRSKEMGDLTWPKKPLGVEWSQRPGKRRWTETGRMNSRGEKAGVLQRDRV